MDSKSERSAKSTDMHKAKVCGLCGKKETANFKRHCDRQHNGEQIVWDSKSELQGEPYCENWRDVALNDNVKPVSLNWLYKKGGNANARSKATQSIADRSEIDQEELQQALIANKEEKKNESIDLQHYFPPSKITNALTLKNLNQMEKSHQPIDTCIQLAQSVSRGRPACQAQVLKEPARLGSKRVNATAAVADLQRQINQDLQSDIVQARHQQQDLNIGGQQELNQIENGKAQSHQSDQAMSYSDDAADSFGQEDNEYETVSSSPHKRQKLDDGVEFKMPASLVQFSFTKVPVQKSTFDPIVELDRLCSSVQSQTVKTFTLLDLCASIPSPTIYDILNRQSSKFQGLFEIFVHLYKRDWNKYSIPQISGLVCAALIFKGVLWLQMPMKIQSLGLEKKATVITTVKEMLIMNHFSDSIATWFCDNIEHIDDQTLGLLEYMNQAMNEGSIVYDDQFTINMMIMSQLVTIDGQIEGFIQIVKVFCGMVELFQLIKDGIICAGNPSKMNYSAFEQLVDLLQMQHISAFLEGKERRSILETPIDQWINKLNVMDAGGRIQNSSSYKMAFDDIASINQRVISKCAMSGLYAKDLRLVDNRYDLTFHQSRINPNNLQFAIAQFAIAHSKKYQRQLWTVPAGQGKSWIMAAMALIILLQKDATKVHFVFGNKILMKRDITDFARYWSSQNLQDKIEYHCSLDSVDCKEGELILVDEADELIFRQTQQFMELIENRRCICLTATPNNKDREDVEQKTIELFKFQLLSAYSKARLDGHQCGQLVADIKIIPQKEVVEITPDSQDLVDFIRSQLQNRSVLLYCTDKLKSMIEDREIQFYYMDSNAESIKEQMLRELDSGNSEPTGFRYKLIIATDPFAMRGFDYRAKTTGITLVIAKSFAHEREAIQGLNRVGRFGDQCKRIMLAAVPLIDDQQSFDYRCHLNKLISEQEDLRIRDEKKKEEEKAAKEEEKKQKALVCKQAKKNEPSSQARRRSRVDQAQVRGVSDGSGSERRFVPQVPPRHLRLVSKAHSPNQSSVGEPTSRSSLPEPALPFKTKTAKQVQQQQDKLFGSNAATTAFKK